MTVAKVAADQPEENIKVVVEERVDEQGRRVKVTRKIKMTLVTESVCPQVAARSVWKKFGDAISDGPGPNLSSTIIGEPVFLKLSMTKDHDSQPAKASVVEVRNVVCSYCQGAHWSARCPYKSTFAEEADTGKEESSKPLKYVPPSLRRSAESTGTFEGTTNAPSHRDNPNTIRISNLSEICTDADIRDLVSPIAAPARVYVLKDQKTLRCRGSAFVSFHLIEDVERAIKVLNGRPYGNLILQVELAKPQAP